MLAINGANARPPSPTQSFDTRTINLTLDEFTNSTPLEIASLLQQIMTTDGVRISAKGFRPLNPGKFKNPLRNYEKHQHLGSGRNGSVHEYEHKGEILAVKTGYHDGNRARLIGFLNEAVNHFIASRHMPEDVIGIRKVLINKEKILFVLEKGTQSLEQLSRSGALSLNQIMDIGLAFRGALDRLHEAGICHNDIKPDNVLVTPRPDGGWAIKIIDFGASSRNPAQIEREAGGAKKLLDQLLRHYRNFHPGASSPLSPEYAKLQMLRG